MRSTTSLIEFLFKLLQPSVEDLLFLGPDYEMAFDRFEALLALNYLYETVQQDDDGGFALPGRYAYKRGRSGDPYMILLEEANRQGGMWPPIVQGAMPHYQTFLKLHASHKKFIDGLHW
ncbi:MAG: hypothetical protein IPO12_14360 [Flavobacteriales bacterium]|nr:hypothetical protein [Flavobacteriales bacterium]